MRPVILSPVLLLLPHLASPHCLDPAGPPGHPRRPGLLQVHRMFWVRQVSGLEPVTGGDRNKKISSLRGNNQPNSHVPTIFTDRKKKQGMVDFFQKILSQVSVTTILSEVTIIFISFKLGPSTRRRRISGKQLQ